jgi:hypothetical protein
VELFQRTHSMLKASPDVNPPRNIVFEFEKPGVNRFWKWVIPMAAAAVLLMGVALTGPIHVEWNDSQLIVAFGAPPAPFPSTALLVPPQGAVPSVAERVVAEPVDYTRIEKLVADEVAKRDIARTKEMQRVQGQLAYLEALQLATERNVMATDSSVQQLAMRSASEE